jgi:nicotinamidase-related amidase
MSNNSIHQHLTVKAGLSQLLLVDMQARLMPAMHADAMQAVLKNCTILATASALFEIPVVLTEQYAKGLGHTAPELLAVLPQIKAVDKMSFSAMAEVKCSRQFTRDHTQVIVAGMEAHICVLQTALDLVKAGKQVFVVADAIISRNPEHKANALARMRDAGCIVSNTESILFEWMGKAEGDVFKTLSKLIR